MWHIAWGLGDTRTRTHKVAAEKSGHLFSSLTRGFVAIILRPKIAQTFSSLLFTVLHFLQFHLNALLPAATAHEILPLVAISNTEIFF